MTRAELEALLAMEGKWLVVRPHTPNQRCWKYRNKSATAWIAEVWSDFKNNKEVEHLYKRLGLPIDDIDHETTIVDMRRVGVTNHQAVKQIIEAYLKETERRANNR